MSLHAQSVSFAYGRHQVLRGLDCELAEGRITAIVGANASGKSTLLRAMARLIEPQAGSVLLDGTPIGKLPTREVARRVGFLPQAPIAPEGLTVGDLVARGRYPHQRLGRPQSAHDRERIEWALAATDTTALRDRPLDQLSGGQRQRVCIGRVAEAPSHATAVATKESLRSADIRTRLSGCDAARDYAGSDTDDA